MKICNLGVILNQAVLSEEIGSHCASYLAYHENLVKKVRCMMLILRKPRVFSFG